MESVVYQRSKSLRRCNSLLNSTYPFSNSHNSCIVFGKVMILMSYMRCGDIKKLRLIILVRIKKYQLRQQKNEDYLVNRMVDKLMVGA